MQTPRHPPEKNDFLSVVRKLKFLSEKTAQELVTKAESSENTAAQIALQNGILDPVQVDIVQTLLHPTEAIADYEILNVLGKGGMGVVYRARQKSLDRIVAIKTVLISQMNNPELVTRFEREAVTVAQLQHPHIVAAHDFGRHSGRLYFVMELVEGEDLEKRIDRQGQLDEPTALGLIRQAAGGLLHATEMGVVHRDIKPANLLLVQPPAGFPLPVGMQMVKIADFGLAFLSNSSQEETRLTSANSTLGSPHYMAPEQLDGAKIDHKADYYALGATLYHMLTGRRPFEAETLSQIITKKVSGKYTPVLDFVSGVSQFTCDLIDEMLVVDPNERLADFSNLIARIDSHLQANQGVLLEGDADSNFETTITTTPISLLKPQLKTESPKTEPELEKQPSTAKNHRLRNLLFGLIGGALFAIGFFFFNPFAHDLPASIPERNMISSGWRKSLFNGANLEALPESGQWGVAEDDEGGKVIAGTNGTILQPLFYTDIENPTPLKNYRFSFFLRLRKTTTELHFAIEATPNRNGPRFVLRLAPEGIILARKQENEGELGAILQEKKEPVDSEKLHVIRLERQHNHFWVFVDDRLIGTVAAPEKQQLPEVRLHVENGTAWFSDIRVERLIPKGE